MSVELIDGREYWVKSVFSDVWFIAQYHSNKSYMWSTDSDWFDDPPHSTKIKEWFLIPTMVEVESLESEIARLKEEIDKLKAEKKIV